MADSMDQHHEQINCSKCGGIHCVCVDCEGI